MEIQRISETDCEADDFINETFSDYAQKNGIALNYEPYCFAAEENGRIVGVITGRAYYNEVHIGDLIVAEAYRHQHVGTKLVRAVEEAYAGKEYTKITLTTFGFQAPAFYKKLGYTLEYIREDTDPRLSKFFYMKAL